MKSIIGVLFIVVMVMVIGSVPTIIVQAEDKGVIMFTSESGTLSQSEVKGQLEAKGVGSNDVFSAKLDEKITNIGSNAFICLNLINIEIPNSVTNIGSFAFYECTGLRAFK